MPRADQTGPQGRGPGTGRGAGNCSVESQQGNRFQSQISDSGNGRGGGRGFRGGRGQGLRMRRRGFFGSSGALDEKATLDSQKEALESRLNDVNQQLEALNPSDPETD